MGWWPSPSEESQVLGRHGVHQPYPIGRHIERVSRFVHGGRIDDQHYWPAVAAADLRRRGHVERQVDVVPGHLAQAVAEDDLDVALAGAVVEDVGRGGGLEL